ncbi:MAG: SDR family oxidoreductase [Candidatus Kapaibacterium sp.]|nr:SDR family oxidoreductase [Ignavibacteriota bacterium]MCB9221211.1 SDR family oxidoreductase [Ignavibacteria bacterium]
MNIELKGKTALVCGGTDGIGRASAVELATLGANVVLMARSEEKLQKVLESLPVQHWQKHDYIVADFINPEAVRDSTSNYIKKNGNIQILINNTGGPPSGALLNVDAEEFYKGFDMHLKCSHYLTQTLFEGMKDSRYGRIVNIISTSVKIPISGLGVSNTVRGAMASWSKTLANEIAMYGITVNNVLPGFTMTNRLESLIAKKAESREIGESEVESEMLATIPAARFADPEEVANAVAFLSTPAAAYINGINLPVDGGRLGCL